MAEEQDIKQETVDETVETTNVETPAVEEAEEVVAGRSSSIRGAQSRL